MGIKKNTAASGKEYCITYKNMCGVDLSHSGSAANRRRFSWMQNMYKDYSGEDTNVIESIPGFRRIFYAEQRINGIYSYKNNSGKEQIVIHAGSYLYGADAERIANDAFNNPFLAIGRIQDAKSKGFSSGNMLYIFLGNDIITLDGDGVLKTVNDTDSGFTPYIPTLYVNGEEYEQKNLLTNYFKEEYTIFSSTKLSSETENIKYRITSEEKAECAVIGLNSGHDGILRIPAYKTLGGNVYKVTEIAENAFLGDTKLSNVYCAEGLQKVGNLAFSHCTALTRCSLPSTIEKIGRGCFYNCSALTSLYLGKGLKTVGKSFIYGTSNLPTVLYGGDEDTFAEIENKEEFGSKAVSYNRTTSSVNINVPIFSPAINILKTYIDGVETSMAKVRKNGYYTAISLTGEPGIYDGKKISVLGELDETKFTAASGGKSFLEQNGNSISGIDAIKGCTVFTSFDGRIFLSGNPEIPNTVFYSSRDNTGKNNPLYYGILNYFNDGIGNFPVISMLASGDSLAVFKGGNDGDGSIYYHYPKETGEDLIPKIYPVSYIHGGVSALGDAVSFFDDTVFLSSLGLSAITKRSVSLERNIVTRSENVNRKLLTEDLKNATIAKWCGYLVLCTGDTFYLADSRSRFYNSTGELQYDWYLLSGIGSYRDDERVFRYSSTKTEGYELSDTPEEICKGTVYGEDSEDAYMYYERVGDKKIKLEKTEEYTGGVYSPAAFVFSPDENLLFFGTESGDVCVFNNDKRGIPPPYMLDKDDFDIVEYQKDMKRKIHPYYYSFAGHSPVYQIKTPIDDGNIPDMTKNTVKNSLILKLRTFGRGLVTLEVGTNRSGYKEVCRIPDSSLDFDFIDFSNLSFTNSESITVCTGEKEKKWVEKQLSLYSNTYGSPMGIYSITYRFSVKGKIK